MLDRATDTARQSQRARRLTRDEKHLLSALPTIGCCGCGEPIAWGVDATSGPLRVVKCTRGWCKAYNVIGREVEDVAA